MHVWDVDGWMNVGEPGWTESAESQKLEGLRERNSLRSMTFWEEKGGNLLSSIGICAQAFF